MNLKHINILISYQSGSVEKMYKSESLVQLLKRLERDGKKEREEKNKRSNMMVSYCGQVGRWFRVFAKERDRE